MELNSFTYQSMNKELSSAPLQTYTLKIMVLLWN